MATFNQRYGWLWTDQERAERKQAIWRAQREMEKVRSQAKLVQQLLPDYAAIFRAMVAVIETLLSLNVKHRRPPYQELSPDEADGLLQTWAAVRQRWQAFARSPAYVAAVREVNRDRRKQSQLAKAAQEALWQKLQPAYEATANGDITAFFKYLHANQLKDVTLAKVIWCNHQGCYHVERPNPSKPTLDGC